MNRPRTIAVCTIFAIALSIGTSARAAAAAAADEPKPATPVEVRSPDGRVVISLRLREGGGQAVYRVSYNGNVVIDESPLGLTFAAENGGRFDSALAFERVERASGDETYAVIAGKSAMARNHYNEATVSLKCGSESDHRTPVQVVLRAYDEGAAFRYQFPSTTSEPLTIASEETTFNLPADAKAWVLHVPNVTSHYEYLYEPKPVSEIETGKLIGLPLLLECAGNGPAVAITEANLTITPACILEPSDAGETARCAAGFRRCRASPSVTVKWRSAARFAVAGDHDRRHRREN